MPGSNVEWESGGKKIIRLVEENVAHAAMGRVGDCKAYEEVSPGVVASFCVYLGEF